VLVLIYKRFIFIPYAELFVVCRACSTRMNTVCGVKDVVCVVLAPYVEVVLASYVENE
jgi:hypothetical protein